jgi:hypothetical protein
MDAEAGAADSEADAHGDSELDAGGNTEAEAARGETDADGRTQAQLRW